jgi:hypothetical protein
MAVGQLTVGPLTVGPMLGGPLTGGGSGRAARAVPGVVATELPVSMHRCQGPWIRLSRAGQRSRHSALAVVAVGGSGVLDQ